LSSVRRDREIGTVLVTGGCGFIGSNFIRHIMSRWDQAQVVNLDCLTYAGRTSNLNDIEDSHGGQRYFFVQGDICDATLVDSLIDGSYFGQDSKDSPLAPNIVINFAAETHVDRSIDDASPFIRTNVLGTQTLLEAARKQWTGVKVAGQNGTRLFLQISTDEVYGSLGEEGCFDEDCPLAPNSPYAASKAGADLLARSYHNTFGLPVIITRSSNNYGPFQFTEKFIPNMITKALAGLNLPIYGDGRNVRDWIHVEDNCQAIEWVVRKGIEGEVYNIGGGAELRNLEVAQRILQMLDKPQSLISFVEDRLGHDWRYSVDSTRVRELGWKPKHTFEEGLEDTVQWYVDHGG
jgi:dTDP-glucose 4,6-dehydratase